jgi:hypothetical protein
MVCAAAGAVAVGAVVALTGLSHQPAPEPSDTAELLGGPPGYALGTTDPSSSSAAPTTTTLTTTTTTSKPASSKKSAPPARSGGAPAAGNTGVPSGTSLTVVTGNQTFSGSGDVIEGKDFHGFVKVTGKNITFRNCVFRGAATSGNNALLDVEDATNTVVEDSEFAPSNPSATIDDIWAANATITRANIHGGVDGMKADSNTVVQDSWIHDMTWFASDPNQGGGETHNDGVQSFAGASHVTLRHNTIDMSTTKDPNAAWQSSASNSLAENNFFDGGGCMLNFDHKSTGHALGGIAIVNNRFGRHSAFQCPILLSSQASLSQNTGNVWADTGAPIPAPQQHD